MDCRVKDNAKVGGNGGVVCVCMPGTLFSKGKTQILSFA